MPSPTNERAVDEIESLRTRFEELNTQRIQAKTRLDETQRQLEVLQAEAKAQWGTSDLAALQKMLEDQQTENERLRVAYQASLTAIEEGLKKIEVKN